MANIITIIRLLGTIPLIYMLLAYNDLLPSFILFIILGFTDFLDGYLARKYNKVSNFGKIADGIADKFLMLSVTICLLIRNIIPYWTLLIFIRDILSCVFALIYISKTKIVIKSNIFGKIKTVSHIFSIAFTLLLGKWTIISSILLIIAIMQFIPEIFYIIKVIKCSK